MSKFAVLISAGTPTDYSRKQGWDGLCDSREEAEALAARARRNSGWSAKVIAVGETEAARWDETVSQRLERKSAEFDSALRNGTLYGRAETRS